MVFTEIVEVENRVEVVSGKVAEIEAGVLKVLVDIVVGPGRKVLGVKEALSKEVIADNEVAKTEELLGNERGADVAVGPVTN